MVAGAEWDRNSVCMDFAGSHESIHFGADPRYGHRSDDSSRRGDGPPGKVWETGNGAQWGDTAPPKLGHRDLTTEAAGKAQSSVEKVDLWQAGLDAYSPDGFSRWET